MPQQAKNEIANLREEAKTLCFGVAIATFVPESSITNLSVDARLRQVRQSLLDGSKDNALFGLWLVVDGNSESLDDFLAQAVFNRNSLSFA